MALAINIFVGLLILGLMVYLIRKGVRNKKRSWVLFGLLIPLIFMILWDIFIPLIGYLKQLFTGK